MMSENVVHPMLSQEVHIRSSCDDLQVLVSLPNSLVVHIFHRGHFVSAVATSVVSKYRTGRKQELKRAELILVGHLKHGEMEDSRCLELIHASWSLLKFSANS